MFKNYEQIISFFNKRKQFGIKLGLERMNRLLSLLDNPQHDMTGIHVAGTNGKGSTITYLEHALIANSYNVGVFTSPSLTDLTGHIFLNGQSITIEIFIDIFNQMYPAIKKLDQEGDPPTEFEIITGLAFVYFSKHTDIALIETGMGGLEDTTNCFDPVLSIITNIAKDHTDFLGDTITEIAKHKSGIIKRYRPVIIGERKVEATKIIKRVANEKQADLYQLHEDFTYTKSTNNLNQGNFLWKNADQVFEISLKMAGEHQMINSSLALMGLLLLIDEGFLINMNKSIKSINKAVLPGRFEIIKKEPVLILDGAHNIAGMKAFLNTVQTYRNKGDKHLLFAGFKDKDLYQMLEIISPYFTSITLTTFKHPRASKVEDLLHMVEHNKHTYITSDWKRAIKQMLGKQADKKATYFITGSLHFISIVRKYINEID